MYDPSLTWVNKYIGIPFVEHGRSLAGLDCYGLIYLVYAVEKAIFLPKHNETYKDIEDKETIKQALMKYSKGWMQIAPGEEKAFDVLIANMMNYPMHCALVVRRGHMLHALEGCNSVCESYTEGKWRAPGRIVGFYRHEAMT